MDLVHSGQRVAGPWTNFVPRVFHLVGEIKDPGNEVVHYQGYMFCRRIEYRPEASDVTTSDDRVRVKYRVKSKLPLL